MTVISEEDSDNSQNSILSNISQTQSPSIDADLSRLENQMNSWSLDFKRNILVCPQLIFPILLFYQINHCKHV